MTQFNSPGYEVARFSGVCEATGAVLEPGERYFAALVEIPEEQIERGADGRPRPDQALGMRRVDVSVAAWDGGFRPAGLFSFWKSTVAEPNQKKKLFVDDVVLMSLLVRLADAAEPERIAFRYVLGLILLRKKLLRYDGSVTREVEVADEDGSTRTVSQVWWRLTPKQDATKGHFGRWNEQATMELLDPKLDEEAIGQVAGQLNEIFEAEL